jgi:RNA polymerase sigma-70 factor (ECF subfamily)
VQKLLIRRPGKQARIADYEGRGTLASWVCVAAVRTAIEVARLKSPRQVPLDSTRLSASVAAGRPDLELIRHAHGADFKAALEEAFARLSSEERNLLRLSVLEGVGIDKLAGIFAAHRSTVARRLQRVRKQLFDDTRRTLSQRLGVRGPDLDSLMRAVDSQLQLSLSHLFSAERQR